MIPVPFAAEHGNRIVRLDSGHQDAGAPVPFLIESAAVAPAGAEGDCAFDRLRLVLTWTAAAAVTVTPILDGAPLPASAHTVELQSATERRSRVYELVLRRRSVSGHSYALRGTWLAVRIEGTAGDGDLIVDPSVIEFEVLTPTQQRPA